MMKGNAPKFHVKEKRLLQLYSLWQETRSVEIQRKCLHLLGEILAKEPHFSLRSEFQIAF